MGQLGKTVHSIQSRETLARFVIDLAQDLKERPEAWENVDLESYLRAIAAWVIDMDGYYKNQGKPVPEHPDWKFIGEILLAARVYE